MVTVIIRAMVQKEEADAGGMTKLGVRLRFMVLPCLMKKVVAWEMQIPKTNEANQMGTTLMTSFTSSTWVIVASFHGPCLLAP